MNITYCEWKDKDMDKFSDTAILDFVGRIRKSRMDVKIHPLDDVAQFFAEPEQ